MDDNTFPNLMAILTGYNQTTSYQLCDPKHVGQLGERDCNSFSLNCIKSNSSLSTQINVRSSGETFRAAATWPPTLRTKQRSAHSTIASLAFSSSQRRTTFVPSRLSPRNIWKLSTKVRSSSAWAFRTTPISSISMHLTSPLHTKTIHRSACSGQTRLVITISAIHRRWTNASNTTSLSWRRVEFSTRALSSSSAIMEFALDPFDSCSPAILRSVFPSSSSGCRSGSKTNILSSCRASRSTVIDSPTPMISTWCWNTFSNFRVVSSVCQTH